MFGFYRNTKDGILISTSNGSEGVGFKSDGTVLFGKTDFNIIANSPSASIKIDHVNKERKLNTQNVYLLTEQFDKTTRSTQPGVEVVLKVTTPGYSGIRIGQEITATVVSVNQVDENPNENSTSILPGQIVLSSHSESSQYAALSALQKDEQITINTQNANDDVDWSKAVQALGIFHVLVKNGTINEGLMGDPAIHPRTVFGTKADGTVVLFQCDGRQAGFAAGLTFREIVDYMTGLGCVNVFNFDGGGSSTITATLPGKKNSQILNRPSDGHERANSNALLFVADNSPVEGNPVQKLHVYPDIAEGYSNKVLLLENGKMKFTIGATDNNYHYSDLSGTKPVYSTQGGIGEISEDGVLSAAEGAHSGKVIVQGPNGSSGEITVDTVDQITKLNTDRSILSVAPGATTQMSFSAEYNGIPVVLTSEALTFQLSDDALGSISKDGTFTAAQAQGTGSLKISYKDYEVALPVEIGKLPVPLNDFEVPLEDAGWKWQYTNPGNGGSGNVSVNYDERFVKTGDGSLRIDYDFATKPATGTVAIEVGPSGKLQLEGQPKAIGCWVYGDGNGSWFRIQLAPSSYERLYKAWGAHITDLEPDTTYYYKVGQGSSYSEIKSFKTAPLSGDLTIAFYGDVQGSFNKFPDTANALKSLYPNVDLSLLAGDVADNGHIYSDWQAIDANMGGLLSSGIWAATIGNHDSYFDAQTFTSYFYGPDNGTYETARNYFFEIGDMLQSKHETLIVQ